VESLVPATTISTTIAVIDTGVTIAGANPLDVPAGQFVNITPLPAAFTNSGAPVGGPFALAAVADGSSSGHGTSVTAVAAGRGTTTLGTGMHLRVRPVRYASNNFWHGSAR
jgi:hypothetical protein